MFTIRKQTFVQGAIGAMTFGAYHQYTTNKILELQGHKLDMDLMAKEHKRDMEMMNKKQQTQIDLLEERLNKSEEDNSSISLISFSVYSFLCFAFFGMVN